MKPTQEQVIAWARETGLHIATDVHWMPIIGLEYLEKATALAYEAGRELAKLDSTHTCHDQCQRPPCVAVREAYEAGRKDENEACAKEVAAIDADGWEFNMAAIIRARREHG